MENQRLSEVVGGLEHSLNAPITGREYAWAERVGWALAAVERMLLRLVPSAEDQNCKQDFSRPRMRVVDGHLAKLWPELLQQCKDLRRAVQDIAQPFTTPRELDLNPILEEGRNLLTALHQHLETEVNLLCNDSGAQD